MTPTQQRSRYLSERPCPGCGGPVSIASLTGLCTHCRGKAQGKATPRKCLDCGIVINAQSMRCRPCHRKHVAETKLVPPSCPDCGARVSGHDKRCQACAGKARQGPSSANWKGDDVSQNGGRVRAIRRYRIDGQSCVDCGKAAKVRHHSDRDVANNQPDNIEFLCYLCHARRHVEDYRAAGRRRREQRQQQLCSPDSTQADAILANQLRRLYDFTYDELAKAMQPPRSLAWVRNRLVFETVPNSLDIEAIFAAIESISAEN